WLGFLCRVLEFLLEDGVKGRVGDAQGEDDLRAGALSGNALLAAALPESGGDQDSGDEGDAECSTPMQEKGRVGSRRSFPAGHTGEYALGKALGSGPCGKALAQFAFEVVEL